MELCASATIVILGVCMSTAAVAADIDKVGIEACDTFLEKYEACMKDKAGTQRAQFDQMITQLRSTWKQAAADPQTKPAIEQSCKQTIDNVKQSLNAAPYNCGF